MIKSKGNKLCVKWKGGKDMIIHLITGLIKKMLNEILPNAIPLYKMSQYFPKPYKPF